MLLAYRLNVINLVEVERRLVTLIRFCIQTSRICYKTKRQSNLMGKKLSAEVSSDRLSQQLGTAHVTPLETVVSCVR